MPRRPETRGGRGAVGDSPAKARHVAAARQFDLQRVGAALGRVVLDEPAPQPPGLHAHERIGLRIEIAGAAEYFDRDRVALQTIRGARELALYDVAQQLGRSPGLLEATAAENALELRAHVGVRGFARRKRGFGSGSGHGNDSAPI
jgi:hypothetical protein